jgi:cyanate permease
MPVPWVLLLGLWLCYFAFGAIAASTAPLVIQIQADLDLSYAAIGSIMGAWQFVYIGAAIPAGVLLDRLGGRWALLIGTSIIGLSAISRAWAEDYWSLLLAVMLFGLGGPIVSSGAPKVVTEIYQGTRRGLAMGIYMTGPTLGGILTLTLTHSILLPVLESWRALMVLWGTVALLAGSFWFVIATGIGRQVTGFSYAARPRASSTGSRVALGSLFRIPGVTLILVMSVGVFLINHGLNNWLPEMLRHGGMTMTQAGYWAALPMLIGILGSLTIPRLATPQRRFAILMGLCLAAAFASLLLTFTHPAFITSALLIQGLVRSSLMTVLILTLMELPGLDPQKAGTASGLFFSAAEIGGVLGPLTLGFTYDLSGGFNAGLYGLTAVCVAMMLGTGRLAALVRQRSLSDP